MDKKKELTKMEVFKATGVVVPRGTLENKLLILR